MVALVAGLVAGGLTTGAALATRSHGPAAGSDQPRFDVALAAAVEDLEVERQRAAAAAAVQEGVVATEQAAAARLEAERQVELAARAFQEAGASRAAARPVLTWPAAGGLTGWWGERRGGHIHPGIDIDGETGDPVVAAGPGVVVHAGPAPVGYGGYGVMVLIDHGSGLQTLYAHLSSLAVAPGQAVGSGQVVGAIGTTGRVTGSHLHFEVRMGGAPVDPRPWLPSR